jgi:hypothetical protein
VAGPGDHGSWVGASGGPGVVSFDHRDRGNRARGNMGVEGVVQVAMFSGGNVQVALDDAAFRVNRQGAGRATRTSNRPPDRGTELSTSVPESLKISNSHRCCISRTVNLSKCTDMSVRRKDFYETGTVDSARFGEGILYYVIYAYPSLSYLGPKVYMPKGSIYRSFRL